MRKAKVWDARQLPAYLTVAQYGELMGICPKTVRRMCQRGELPAHKEGPKLWRIDKNAALEQRQEAMEICQRNARKAPKNKKPAGAGTPTSLRQLLILDEPFNFLDPSSQSIIKHMLKKYSEEHNATVIISSHNLNHTIDVCPRIALLENGVIILDIINENNSAEKELEDYFNVEE